jgi:hypothetical protein
MSRMTDPSRESLSQVDAGWDDLASPSGVAALSTSGAPSADLDALDDGWSEASHSAPVANAAPLTRAAVSSTPPAELDDLDEGWGDDDAPMAPRHSQPQLKRPAGSSKKAKRKLERELKAQQVKTVQQRSQAKKESRREADKHRHAEAEQRAQAERLEQEARRAAKREATKKAKPKMQAQAKPKAANPPRPLITNEATKPSAIQSPGAKTGVPSYVLWGVLIAALIAVGYWVTRR